MTQIRENKIVPVAIKLTDSWVLLLQESKKSLPFCEFGQTGGYGSARRLLVDAIKNRSSREVIEAQFKILVRESLQEMIDEERENRGRELDMQKALEWTIRFDERLRTCGYIVIEAVVR